MSLNKQVPTQSVIPINKERVKLLVDALRSGTYSQTTKHLRDETGFCCLGVACDIYNKSTGGGQWEPMEEYIEFDDGEGGLEGAYLTKEVAKWFGFNSKDPRLSLDGISLAGLNDLGKSFNEIADAIERNFLNDAK